MIIKKKFKIDGMHCTSCSMMIDGDLEDTKGVVSSSTNYATGETEVEFNEGEIAVEGIIKTIKNTGYEPSLAN